MILLIFFALPLATILLSIVLEKILRSPILVAITFFAIYLIILFILFATGVITDLAIGLIAIIIYTILAFITASIVKLIKCIIEKISNRCSCNTNNELSLVNNTDRNCDGDVTATNTSIAVSGNIIPNQCNGGRSGCIRGCYRRC